MQEQLQYLINQSSFTRKPTAELAPFRYEELVKALDFHRNDPRICTYTIISFTPVSQNLRGW
ncbi:hypothetical protein AB8849_16670 [Proteus vulgaris]